MATNSIGEFGFLSLIGHPPGIQQELELLQRPGVNGVGLWKTGFRGRPFRLRSLVDAQSKEDAREYYTLYCELIGADPVQLIYSDHDSEDEGYRVAVLSVTPLDIRALANSAGGLNSPSLGWIECDWDLVSVAI